MTIPKIEDRLPESPIPEIVAEVSQTAEAPEAKPILISFERYNNKECQLDGMDGKMAKKVLRVVRDVGVKIKTESDFKKHLSKLQIVSVGNNGDYRKLYKGLADLPDVEIKEAKIEMDKCRLFFFMIDRIFHIIAMRDSHYDTDKQRR